ncbi:spore protease YyaC [Siminovitchia sp. 179-K 8D1 HS]|uniref:spore protease YyaC n=1 Tax=Siminovitchia sp. 179-K 8D1 HS TaxID=3142385 RepID=UPI0039A111F1
MAGNEEIFEGVRLGRYSNEPNKLAKDLSKYINDEVFFVCIGTDRNIGDSFGPFVGTFLKEKGYDNVIGTIDDPVHAKNLEDRMKEVPKNRTVIAIDASVSSEKNIGLLSFHSGKLFPGSGVGKNLPSVGDFHINGIVSGDTKDSYMNLMRMANLRLSDVIELSKQCVAAIESAFPLKCNNIVAVV